MSTIQQIPLAQLRISPRNARKTGGQSVADLAASIAAEGLLQNLVVTDAGLQIHRKVRGWAASMVVHVTHDGTLAAVATTRPQSYSPPKGHDLVGTYTATTPVEHIEDDLIQYLRDMTGITIAEAHAP